MKFAGDVWLAFDRAFSTCARSHSAAEAWLNKPMSTNISVALAEIARSSSFADARPDNELL
jgi:hypothetical protein